MLNETAQGVFTIAVTPFLPNGALDFASIDRMVDAYIERGLIKSGPYESLGELSKKKETWTTFWNFESESSAVVGTSSTHVFAEVEGSDASKVIEPVGSMVDAESPAELASANAALQEDQVLRRK